MNIIIIGDGYVGSAVERFLAPQHFVQVKGENIKWEDIIYSFNDQNIDLAVVCVPTPSGIGGSCDISIVEQVISECPVKNIIIKSTVPPGTCDHFAEKYNKHIAFCPEFIGEGHYPVGHGEPHPTNMHKHDFCIIGGNEIPRRMWKNAISFLYGAKCRFILVTAKEAELAKYTINAWLATKVTFCNEMAAIADHFGCDWDQVREAWLADGRVTRSHTLVNNGYGGKCLSKDISGISHAAQLVGYDTEFLDAVIDSNKRFTGET